MGVFKPTFHKEAAMAPKSVRARVHQGHFEPLEKAVIPPEGSEVTLTFDFPEQVDEKKRVVFETYDMGVYQPLTREATYDETD